VWCRKNLFDIPLLSVSGDHTIFFEKDAKIDK
jgi:hypothetical protein